MAKCQIWGPFLMDMRSRGCGANVAAWQPYFLGEAGAERGISTSCIYVLGPVAKVILEHGDPEEWPENTSGTSVFEITAAPDPVLPLKAGGLRGAGKDRHWRIWDMRDVEDFSEFADASFWRPVLDLHRGRPTVVVW